MRKLITFALAVGTLALSGKAHAWLSFCNESDKGIYVAYTRYQASCAGDSQPWEVRGWWHINPYQCTTVDGSDLQQIGSTNLFYRAESDDGGTTVWSGNSAYWFNVSTNGFDRCIDIGVSCGGCGNETQKRAFGQFNVGGANNYTFSFWKEPPLHTLSSLRRAGSAGQSGALPDAPATPSQSSP
jgi:uncharacterized membrane protein